MNTVAFNGNVHEWISACWLAQCAALCCAARQAANDLQRTAGTA
jgi:hypothetical protein